MSQLQELSPEEANRMLAEIRNPQPPPTEEDAFASGFSGISTGDTPPDPTPNETAQLLSEQEKKEDASFVKSGIRLIDAVGFMMTPQPPPEWIIPDLIAKGMKGDLYGKSKTMKTFAALQLAHCLATGRKFLIWDLPRPVNVAYFNLELIPFFEQERMSAQQTALDAHPEMGHLFICNIRNRGHELRNHTNALVRQLQRSQIDIAIIDPRYKLVNEGEDENTAEGLRGVLNFRDALSEVCAVLVVGHDPKGDVGGKAIQDRGAGSYTAGADYDFCFALSPHEQEAYTVLSASSRYRKSPDDITVAFDPATQIFSVVEDVPAVKKPPQNRKPIKTQAQKDAEKAAAFKAEETIFDNALSEILAKHNGLANATGLQSELIVRSHIGRDKCRTYLKAKIASGELSEQEELIRDEKYGGVKPKPKKAGGVKFIGTAEAIAAYRKSFDTLGI